MGAGSSFPQRVDLRQSVCFPSLPVRSQGRVPECVSAAFAAALYCALRRRGLQRLPDCPNDVLPDTGQLHARATTYCPGLTDGVTIACVLRALADLYGAALRALGCKPHPLPPSRTAICKALGSGVPVVVGYRTDARRETFHADDATAAALSYRLPPFQGPHMGAHCVLLLGYLLGPDVALARNSYGASWGLDGHFLIALSDLEDLAQCPDRWVLS